MQQTRYPWEGKIDIRITLETPVEFTLALRIPGWCKAAGLALDGKNLYDLELERDAQFDHRFKLGIDNASIASPRQANSSLLYRGFIASIFPNDFFMLL